MLVCHCNGVSDKAIRRAVRDGAANSTEVGDRCAAGTCCAGCVDLIDRIIRSESPRRESAPRPSRGSPESSS